MYVTILSNMLIGISGDPQTMASSSLLVNMDNNGTGTTLAIPSRTHLTCSLNSCNLYSLHGKFQLVTKLGIHFPKRQNYLKFKQACMYSCLLNCVTCLCSVLKTTVRPVDDVVQNDISRFVNSSSPSRSRTYSNPKWEFIQIYNNLFRQQVFKKCILDD